MLSKRVSKFVLGSAAIAGLGATANAGLTYDMVATGATSGVISEAGKRVDLTPGVGGTVTFNIVAFVTGQNGDLGDDGFLSGAGSFLSTGGTLGDMAAFRAGNMTGTGSSNGKAQDLDSDGDLDVGSNTTASASNYFAVRANSAPQPVFGAQVLLGSVTFTYGAAGMSGVSLVNWRNRGNASTASWFEDGSQVNANATASNVGVGAPVSLVVPEPTTLGLAAIGALGLLARRRNA